MPYYAERPTIDVLGLNDEHIAHQPGTSLGQAKAGHEKTDPAYVLGRRPEIITWSAAAHLGGHPALQTEYRIVEVTGPQRPALKLLLRRDSGLLQGAQP
jgi:hypothetical protein